MFKKTIKLLIHPRKFFSDSWFFRGFNIQLCQSQHLMIVSTLGQLNQCESYIKINKLKHASLVILYTKKNRKTPRLINNSVNKNAFNSVIYFELPGNIGNLTLSKIFFLKKNYKKLLKMFKPKNIFVMSFSGHYSLLLTESKEQNIICHLLEEGTATYAPMQDKFYIKNSFAMKFYTHKFLNKKGYFDCFDYLHVAFPDLAKQIFKYHQAEFFIAHDKALAIENDVKAIQKKYNISKNDYIYISQRFPIENGFYYSKVVKILHNVANRDNCNIFIKLHPRELESKKIMDTLTNLIKNTDNIIVLDEKSFFIEPLVMYTQVKKIIGITSTALVYINILSPKTEAVSIANELLEELGGECGGTDLIKNHFEILKLFQGVSAL